MDELPRAIQNEIWEYVHGTRAYWKQQFNNTILKVIPYINAELRKRVDDCRTTKKIFVQTFIGHVDAGISLWPPTGLYEVHVTDCSGFWKQITFWTGRGKLRFEEAVKLFYEKVEYEAILAKSA